MPSLWWEGLLEAFGMAVAIYLFVGLLRWAGLVRVS